MHKFFNLEQESSTAKEVNKRPKNHHKGKMVANYMENPHNRQKCFFGRKNTLLTSVSCSLHKKKCLKCYIILFQLCFRGFQLFIKIEKKFYIFFFLFILNRLHKNFSLQLSVFIIKVIN